MVDTLLNWTKYAVPIESLLYVILTALKCGHPAIPFHRMDTLPGLNGRKHVQFTSQVRKVLIYLCFK